MAARGQAWPEMKIEALGDSLKSTAQWSIYICVAQDGTVLYIGMTGRGSGRLAEHVAKPWWVAIDDIRLVHVDTEAEARHQEMHLIQVLRPLFNVSQRPPGPPGTLTTIYDLMRDHKSPE